MGAHKINIALQQFYVFFDNVQSEACSLTDLFCSKEGFEGPAYDVGGHAGAVAEGAEGGAPKLVAGCGVGEEAVVAEEDEDALAVGDGRGRGGVVHLVRLGDAGAGGFAFPEELAGLLVEREGGEGFVFDGGHEDAAGGDDGRGVAERSRGAPEDVGVWAEAVGQDFEHLLHHRSAEGIKKWRAFSVEIAELVVRYGGSLSGEQQTNKRQKSRNNGYNSPNDCQHSFAPSLAV